MNGLKELAEACGFTKTHTGEVQLWLCNVGDLERFAKLVAAKEREACANFVDKILKASGTWPWENADPIRARGEA